MSLPQILSLFDKICEIDAQQDVNLRSVLQISFCSFNISGIPTDFRVDVGAMALKST